MDKVTKSKEARPRWPRFANHGEHLAGNGPEAQRSRSSPCYVVLRTSTKPQPEAAITGKGPRVGTEADPSALRSPLSGPFYLHMNTIGVRPLIRGRTPMVPGKINGRRGRGLFP